MTGTFFVFGRSPLLSFAELQYFFPSATLFVDNVAFIPETIEAESLISLLGGTIKIVRVADEISTITPDALYNALIPYVKNNKIIFGISTYGDKKMFATSKFLRDLKIICTQRGIVARFVESADGVLSSVVIQKQKVVDLVIITKDETIVVGVTQAVQNFQDWNARDWDRPAPDPGRGMLPPKVARMLVNIAKKYISLKKPVLLDPFCGVGTVLGEALLRGFSVVGSDIDSHAVENTQKNITWLQETYPEAKKITTHFFVSDATHISQHLKMPVDAVITEPFMGDPKMTQHGAVPSADTIKNTLKGLEKLYIGCFREWSKILKPDTVVIIAIPQYSLMGKLFTVKNLIDRCETLGYTFREGPYEYSRPQAIVRRQFYVFQKNN